MGSGQTCPMHVFGGRGGGKGRGGAVGPCSGPFGMMMGPTGDGLSRTAGGALFPSRPAANGVLFFNSFVATRTGSRSRDREFNSVAVLREAMPCAAMQAAAWAGMADDVRTAFKPPDVKVSIASIIETVFIVLMYLSPFGTYSGALRAIKSGLQAFRQGPERQRPAPD